MPDTRAVIVKASARLGMSREERIAQRRLDFARAVMSLSGLTICIVGTLVSLFLVFAAGEDPNHVMPMVVGSTFYLLIPVLIRMGAPFSTVKGVFFTMTLLLVLLVGLAPSNGLLAGLIAYLPLVIILAGMVYRAEGVIIIVLCSIVVVGWVLLIDAGRVPMIIQIDSPTQAITTAAKHIVAIIFAGILVIGAMTIFDSMMIRMTEARDAARKATQSKSAFLATIGHEVRTPLNAVIGMADILSRSDLTPAQRQQVATIHDSGMTLLALLNDLLDFSKMEVGELKIVSEPVDTTAMLRTIEQLWEPNAQEKGISFTLEADANLPRTLVTDPLRLRQCIHNLISNAVKFTEDGGVTVRVFYAASMLTVVVRDTGMGIRPEIAEKLFRPFEQGQSDVAIKHGGTGLGLAITRQLARRMGGDVLFSSREGEGTTFRLSVHAAPSTEARAPRLLVVDAIPTQSMIVKSLLKPISPEVVTTLPADLEAVLQIDRFDHALIDGDQPEEDLDNILALLSEAGLDSADQLTVYASGDRALSRRHFKTVRKPMNKTSFTHIPKRI